MAKKPAKTKTKPELASQADPTAKLDAAAFVRALQPVRRLLEDDLLVRARASRGVLRALARRHAQEHEQKRTGDDFDSWQRHFVEQVAAAWILSVVFVRTLEDRGLLDRNRIAGPGADDSLRLFRQLAPSLSERDYLLGVFRELSRFPAARGLFDAAHNPVWLLGPSADASRQLMGLFRGPSAEAPAFRFGHADTRFLGDLYQDLNENVRERYALLQTPDFVEEFILDRTLEPAIARFGLADTDLLDPTCGSGHFLLGAFRRLLEHRRRQEPNRSPRELATLALRAVAGSDINPYAAAIARFRLTLAYLDAAGFEKLAAAPELPLNVVVADSLLHTANAAGQQELGYQNAELARAYLRGAFALDDPEAALRVLGHGYAAVVGNPPYITVKDAVLREEYRKLYTSAAGKYSLSAPFTERFWQLVRPRGYVGMINANSFMKREFGKRLIEEVLPKLNLEAVVNTSGAYIPGHGTPTVMLFGTQEAPVAADVLAVLARRGEPSTPDDASRGLVWTSIVEHLGEVGFENEYVSIARVGREGLSKHPWSLAGGGAGELKELLEERSGRRLGDVAKSIGIASFTLEDEVFLRPREAWNRLGVSEDWLRPMVIGEGIRDWSVAPDLEAIFPYDSNFVPREPTGAALRAMWPYRTSLSNNMLFGGKTKVEGGLKWFEFGRLTSDKLRTPLTITFAFVATHNHFVLDRGGKVFKQTAPIIKLPESATEDDHLALLAYLNSSTACFWMKQVSQQKTVTTGEKILQADPAKIAYEFAARLLEKMPVPLLQSKETLTILGRELTNLAQRRQEVVNQSIVSDACASGTSLEQRSGVIVEQDLRMLEQSRVVQDAIDLLVYGELGLVSENVLSEVVELVRAVENGRTSVCGVSQRSWSKIEDRLRDIIVECCWNSTWVQMLEVPDYKRRWIGTQGRFSGDGRDALASFVDCVEGFLLSRAERWVGAKSEIVTRSQVLQAIADGSVNSAAEFVGSRRTLPSSRVLAECFESAVPYLAALRFTEAGLEKHAAWQRTWDLQRREDAGEPVGSIPVPPKYDAKDYRSPQFFSLRGKLDVPKERFISYPGCESDQDGEPVYGWAGWNHLQRAQALVGLYQDRKVREAWDKERLTPMLAGLLELLPWLMQWHDEPSAEFDGERPGQAYDRFLEAECRELGLTREALRAWRPAAGSRRSKGSARSASGRDAKRSRLADARPGEES